MQQPPQQQGSLKQLPSAAKQQGKIGFFIKPQLPKSKQAQAAAPAYVKVEDSKPKVTSLLSMPAHSASNHIAGIFIQSNAGCTALCAYDRATYTVQCH